jgi:membrane-associated phospholipid phosphatase
MLNRRLARLTSNIFNPFLVGLTVVVLISFASAPSVIEALKWIGLVSVCTILPIFGVIFYLVRKKKADSFFLNLRRQRTVVYWFSGLCALLGFGLLLVLHAPRMLLVTFIAEFVTVIIFAIINLRWKISVHAAWMGGSVTILIILYGWIMAPSLALVPLTAWARIKLGQHSLAQTAVGACLAASIALGVFSVSGVI